MVLNLRGQAVYRNFLPIFWQNDDELAKAQQKDYGAHGNIKVTAKLLILGVSGNLKTRFWTR